MKTQLVLVASILALSGCVNLGGKGSSGTVHYVLNDRAPAPARATPAAPAAPTLIVLDTSSGGLHDGDPLVYSRSAGTRGQYQFARWSERPSKRFASLLRTRLVRQGDWRVSAAGGYVQGDFLLDTELIELYHDAASDPGVARLRVRAELVDLKQRKLLGQQVFERQAALASYDAAGAALAASQAASDVLNDMDVWLASFK